MQQYISIKRLNIVIMNYNCHMHDKYVVPSLQLATAADFPNLHHRLPVHDQEVDVVMSTALVTWRDIRIWNS